MADPISSIRNLGPAVEAAFAKVGITTAQEIRDMGADEAYRRLIAGAKRGHISSAIIAW
jgi:DNA transformation protein